MPGYVEHAEQFAAKGIQGIYVVAVNDVFVMKAWKKDLHAESNQLFHFISDDDAEVCSESILSRYRISYSLLVLESGWHEL